MSSTDFLAPTERLVCMLRPLRLVGAGLLLVAFDFSINGFDLLHDGVGYTLIALGAAYLAPLMLRPRDAGVMKLVVVLAIIQLLRATTGTTIAPESCLLVTLSTLFDLTALASMALFLVAIGEACADVRATQAERAWRQTLVVTVIFHIVPVGGVAVVGLILSFSRHEPVDINLARESFPVLVLLFALLLLPLAWYFVALRATRRHVDSLQQQPCVPIDDRYCPACGHPLQGLEARYCPHCGSPIAPQVAYLPEDVRRQPPDLYIVMVILIAMGLAIAGAVLGNAL